MPLPRSGGKRVNAGGNLLLEFFGHQIPSSPGADAFDQSALLIERLSNLLLACSAPPHQHLKLEENQPVPRDRRAGNQNNE
jgi:hypothetical protein